MKRIRMIIGKTILLMFVLACFVTASCSKSPLKGWTYKSYEGGPPSWENDIGRPGGYGGEDPWR